MKIIYFDIDGTLRDENTGVSEKTKYVIKECKRNGIKTIICTGRNPGSVQKDILELELDGGIYSGGCLVEFENRQIQNIAFPMIFVKEIIDMQEQQETVGKNQNGLAIETGKMVYMNRKASELYNELFREKTKEFSETDRKRIKEKNHFLYEDNIKKFDPEGEKAYKICFTGKQEELEKWKKELEGRCSVVQFIPFGKEWLLECTPEDCDKGQAVKRLNEFLGIEKKDSMSFGDGENDIPLLLATGTGIAMKNGSGKLKEIATGICDSVQNDGIYYEMANRRLIQYLKMM